MKKTYELIFAGTGGQGLVTSGIMVAKAGILDGKNALQTQSYGVAQRGGFSSAEVIISEDEILFQEVLHPDIIIALNDSVISRYKDVKVPVLYDSSMMQDCSSMGWIGMPFHAKSLELGSPKMANIIAIGALIGMVSVVSIESMEQIIRSRFKPAVAEMNIKAIHVGLEMAKEQK